MVGNVKVEGWCLSVFASAGVGRIALRLRGMLIV